MNIAGPRDDPYTRSYSAGWDWSQGLGTASHRGMTRKDSIENKTAAGRDNWMRESPNAITIPKDGCRSLPLKIRVLGAVAGSQVLNNSHSFLWISSVEVPIAGSIKKRAI